MPPSTVRGWLTRVRAGSPTLVAEAIGLIKAAGLDLCPPGKPPAWAGRALPEAVAALGTAPRGYALALAHPVVPPLRLVPAGRTRRFGVIDPTGLLAGLRGWPLIGVLPRGPAAQPRPGPVIHNRRSRPRHARTRRDDALPRHDRGATSARRPHHRGPATR